MTGSIRLTGSTALVMFFVLVGPVWHSPNNGFALEEDAVVAQGEGISVTLGDVQAVKEYFEARDQFTTEEQYRKMALNLKLFAKEARELGLEGENEGEMNLVNPVQEWMRLKNLYLANVLKGTPLDELAIESYYHAHPEKFRGGEGGGEMAPLDENLKEAIRATILAAKRPVVEEETFEELKEKYRVRPCDPKTGGCE